MNAFPAFIPLDGARIVIVGDGPGADAKAQLVARARAEIVRIPAARAADPEAYRGARLAFIAVDDEATAEAAVALAHAAGALVNVVDRPQLGDFHTPAIVDRSPVIAAIGTGGAAPVLATLLRNGLEAQWPERLGEAAALSGELQATVRTALPDAAARRIYWRRVFEGPAGAAAIQGDMEEARRLAAAELERPSGEGRVLFLDPPLRTDLLSLAAVRALAAADRVVAGNEAPEAVLAFVRRDAERFAQAAPAELAEWAREGLTTVWVGADAGLAEAVAALGVRTERLPVAT